MRILVVTSQFPIAGDPNRGRPIQQTLRELARIATIRVLNPVAVYPQWARPRSYTFHAPGATELKFDFEVDYVPYSALPLVSRPFNGWVCGRAIAAHAASFQPDVVLSYWLYPDAYGAMQLTRKLGLPFVAGARGSDIRVRDAVSRWLTRPVVRCADRLLVVSADLGRVAVRDYGADASRVRVIPNGCDASIFRPGDRAAARARLGIATEAELIVYVGRLVPEKGLRELLQAMREVVQARPHAQLALIGDGPMQDELKSRLAADLKLPVHLVGAQPPHQVAAWMTAANLVTLPSYSEGHPNVLVEALACGRPVVATPVGGIPEVVDEHSAILVPARDGAALAQGLVHALTRTWDEQRLAQQYSRDWGQVASDTLRACEEARVAAAKR